MSTPSDPPRKPRLSLQIKAISHPAQSVRTSRTLAAAIDPGSPTSFNTLSNVYATAIERSTPEPVTAIKARPSLRLQTQDAAKDQQLRTPYLGPYLDTPQSAHPASPAPRTAVVFPSAAMTATPPMSAGAVESTASQPYFSFNVKDRTKEALLSPGTPRRRTTVPNSIVNPPYTHPRALHSILRNSPLPPITARSPDTPRRRSQRLQEKAARRVAYNSPLEETITTQTYVRTHVDLLTDDPSPFSPYNAAEDPEIVLDHTMAYTGNETRDGGQTPGPFEEMRRRMAGLQASSPISPTAGGGIRKKNGRKWKEKKRQWVWTIGTDPDDEDAGEPLVPATARPAVAVPRLSVPVKAAVKAAPSVPIIAIPAPRTRTRSRTGSLPAGKAVSMMIPVAPPPPSRVTEVPALVHDTVSSHTPQSSVEPPTPSVETAFEARIDVEMSDASSFASEVNHHGLAMEMDLDMDTPVAVKSSSSLGRYGSRLSSVDSLGPSEPGGQRKDTPIPPDMAGHRMAE